MFEIVNVSSYRELELSGVFLYESIAQGSKGIQYQFDSVNVRVKGGLSYLELTVIRFYQFSS